MHQEDEDESEKEEEIAWLDGCHFDWLTVWPKIVHRPSNYIFRLRSHFCLVKTMQKKSFISFHHYHSPLHIFVHFDPSKEFIWPLLGSSSSKCPLNNDTLNGDREHLIQGGSKKRSWPSLEKKWENGFLCICSRLISKGLFTITLEKRSSFLVVSGRICSAHRELFSLAHATSKKTTFFNWGEKQDYDFRSRDRCRRKKYAAYFRSSSFWASQHRKHYYVLYITKSKYKYGDLD